MDTKRIQIRLQKLYRTSIEQSQTAITLSQREKHKLKAQQALAKLQQLESSSESSMSPPDFDMRDYEGEDE